MSKLLQMQKKRADLAAQMRTIVDAVDSEKGMTQEQEQQWNQMDTEIQALDKSIKMLEAQVALENRLDDFDPAGRPAPVSDDSSVALNATAEYGEFFNQFVRSREISVDARSHLVSVYNTLSTGTDSEGGFILPESWEKTLIKDMADVVLMRQIGTVRPTSSITNLPIVDDKGAAGWVDELGSYPESDMSFANKVLAAWKLGRIMKLSEELLEDESVNLVSEISEAFQETFGVAEEVGFFSGDGVKKPRGVLLDAENGVTAASSSAITYDEIVTLVYSVKESIRKRSTMVMADPTAGSLRKLKSTDGIPLWQPSVQAGQPDLFLGKPVRTTEGMPGIGSLAKAIAFGDFKYYRIADRGRIYMQRLNEKYADVGAVGFRMRKRVDGKLTRSANVKTLTMAA